MKILIISFYYIPDLCAGSFRTSALIEQLKIKKDADIDVVTTMPNRYASLKSDAKSYESADNLKVYRLTLPSHKSGMLDQVLSFISFYRKVMKITKGKNYDVVYATSSRLFTAFLGKRVARKKQIPLFLDIRDIFVDTLKDVIPSPIFNLISLPLRAIEKYTFNDTEHINLVSQGFKSYFLERFNCSSYSFYTNGIDSEFLTYDYANLNKDHLRPNVLYAGNMGEGQGLHHIIPKLARECPNYLFTLIGDGGKKSDLLAACEGILNVTILPPVKRSELMKKYSEADILFLHLNDYDAFKKVLPSKLFEYGATGKPILAGVSGYAADFCSKELINIAVFRPGNVVEGARGLGLLNLELSSRNDFVVKFQRENIMKLLGESLIDVGNKK